MLETKLNISYWDSFANELKRDSQCCNWFKDKKKFWLSRPDLQVTTYLIYTLILGASNELKEIVIESGHQAETLFERVNDGYAELTVSKYKVDKLDTKLINIKWQKRKRKNSDFQKMLFTAIKENSVYINKYIFYQNQCISKLHLETASLTVHPVCSTIKTFNTEIVPWWCRPFLTMAVIIFALPNSDYFFNVPNSGSTLFWNKLHMYI